jgi:hypothetical protein
MIKKRIASYGKMSRLPIPHAWKRQSKSNPSKSYIIQLHQDGILTCDCQGWINRASRDCTHVKELLGEAQMLLEIFDQEQLEELDKPAVRICVSYKIDGQFGVDSDLDRTLRDLAEKYSGDSPTSGSGFGFRDADFDFGDPKNAELFKEEAKKIVGKRGHAYSYEEDDDQVMSILEKTEYKDKVTGKIEI